MASSFTRSPSPNQYGYDIGRVVTTASFSKAEKNASFFPESAAGFADGVHRTEQVTMSSLTYRPRGKQFPIGSGASRSDVFVVGDVVLITLQKHSGWGAEATDRLFFRAKLDAVKLDPKNPNYNWNNEYTCTPIDPENAAPVVVSNSQIRRITALQAILATFGKAGLIGDVTGTSETDFQAVTATGNSDWLFNRGVCIRSAMTPEERVRAEACIEELVNDEYIELTRSELIIVELSDEILPAKPRKPRPVIVGSCGHCSELLQKGKRLTCSRCKRATYCSKTCQKAAWGAHKAQCTEPKK